MHSITKMSALLAACLVAFVDAHGAIISATGDLGGQGSALGIDPSTPRDGTRRRPFQQDTTIFDDQTPAEAQGSGRTLAGGEMNVAAGMTAMLNIMGGMPQVSQGGTVTMTVHQVNADGAGPYTCMVDPTGTGNSFQPMTVTTNVPGRNGRDRNGNTTDFPLVAQMPAGMACTGTVGGQTGVCMVRCQNPARAGPFGGCVPVQMAAPAAQAPVANNGAVNNGAVNNGAVNNGAVNNGAVNNGVNNGAANNGVIDNTLNNGAVSNGAVNNGAANNGVVDNTFNNGAVNNGAANTNSGAVGAGFNNNGNAIAKRSLVAGRALRKF